MYLLLDANVTAGYYLPKSLKSARARERIEQILFSVRSGGSDHFLYIPNFCIAEVFGVFMKYSFGKWNRHVKTRGPIHTKIYNSLVKQFQEDIHNGKFISQYELSRYHVLGINLIGPVDHYYQYNRKKKDVRPMGTFDQLIISMGIQLVKIHGEENVVIITSDSRLADIAGICKRKIPARTIHDLKLDRTEEITGFKFKPSIFPKCLNLKTATKSELTDVFGHWPLEIDEVPKHYRHTKI